jgi:predicted nicotinamide N-methyase
MDTYSSVTYDDQLPERTHIPLLTVDQIKAILTRLRDTYNPPVRGTRVVSRRRIFPPPSGYSLGSTAHLQPAGVDAKHLQPFSRKLACDWLTALISYLQKRLSKGGENLESHETLLDDTAALLAIFAGTASAGKLTRTFTFGHPPSPLVQVEVTDVPLENQDYTTLGAQTWGGAHVLAEIIVQDPHSFGLHPEQASGSTGGMKILELGAGTGLVSLAVYRHLASRGQRATIYATDFNSLVLNNLAHNISINKLAIPGSTNLEISSGPLDWANPDATSPDLFNSVDLVLGADIIYEELHACWIRTCLEKFMRKPRLGSVHRPVFHLVIPLRPTHTFESSTIEGIFPLASGTSGQQGWELVVFTKDSILCEAGDDEADGQVEYVYYTIGWEGKTSETNNNTNAC